MTATDVFFMCMDRSVKLEEVLDNVIAEVRKGLMARGKARMATRDACAGHSSAGCFKAGSELKCKGGWVEDLSTLYRIGETAVGVEGEELPLTTHLALTKIVFGFQECKLKVEGAPKTRERLEVIVERISLVGRFALEVNQGGSSLRLDSLLVNGWGNLRILGQEGRPPGVTHRLNTVLAKHMEAEVVEVVISTLEKEFKRTLAKKSVGRMISNHLSMS